MGGGGFFVIPCYIRNYGSSGGSEFFKISRRRKKEGIYT
jgi:hypothetical protein